MAKLTKRVYEQKKAAILAKIESVKAELEKLDSTISADNFSAEIGERWNGLHDQEYDLRQELKFLEDDWRRRNWTFADHMQHELVMNNID